MAILFFQISAPSLQHLPSYVHSSVLSGKKRKKIFFGPELNLLSVGNLGSIEVCSTVPETKDFFLSNIWKNGCPERLSHFLNITELVSKCQVQAQTQAAEPHVQALSQVSGCRFEPRNNPPVWAQFHFGMAGVRPVNWSCYSHKAELNSFLAVFSPFNQDPWMGSLQNLESAGNVVGRVLDRNLAAPIRCLLIILLAIILPK